MAAQRRGPDLLAEERDREQADPERAREEDRRGGGERQEAERREVEDGAEEQEAAAHGDRAGLSVRRNRSPNGSAKAITRSEVAEIAHEDDLRRGQAVEHQPLGAGVDAGEAGEREQHQRDAAERAVLDRRQARARCAWRASSCGIGGMRPPRGAPMPRLVEPTAGADAAFPFCPYSFIGSLSANPLLMLAMLGRATPLLTEMPHDPPVRPLAGPRPPFVPRPARRPGPRRPDRGGGADLRARHHRAAPAAPGVPQDVLHAISLTETGRAQGGRLRPWPWAINREGKGFWFKNRDEALAFAKASLAEGRRSFDVGCFQINYHWHGHELRLARGDVRPGHRRRLCGAVPAEPLCRARQLVGGGGGLSFADARPRQRLSGAVRPDPRRPRRGAARPSRRPSRRPPRRRSPQSRARAGRGCRAGPKIITIPPETGKARGAAPSRRPLGGRGPRRRGRGAARL